jgi:methylphosphotriester-DNA--protein-cysteine methyltransferase
MAVNAVITTCIYCRPGFSAKPRPENVRTYPMAAAAEAAGYRACLRCRPYRYPPQVTWTTTPGLVCRAVRMILAGSLDDGAEAELGARLGVSGRHLRRLFTQQLGITPDGLAQSQRTHFARRLLDDTDLSVMQIACATGFGSVRQLNRACRQVFRMSPSELRARRRVTDRLVADGACRSGSGSTDAWTGTRWCRSWPPEPFPASSTSGIGPTGGPSSSTATPAYSSWAPEAATTSSSSPTCPIGKS